MQTTCESSVCDEQAVAKGYCAAHYARFIRGADVNVPIEKREARQRQPSDVCLASGCGESTNGGAKGYCPMHYQRVKNGRPLDGEPRYRAKKGTRSICKVIDCHFVVMGWGYCSTHYQRFRKYGDPLHLEIREAAARREGR
jgi:hypothetical protein